MSSLLAVLFFLIYFFGFSENQRSVPGRAALELGLTSGSQHSPSGSTASARSAKLTVMPDEPRSHSPAQRVFGPRHHVERKEKKKNSAFEQTGFEQTRWERGRGGPRPHRPPLRNVRGFSRACASPGGPRGGSGAVWPWGHTRVGGGDVTRDPRNPGTAPHAARNPSAGRRSPPGRCGAGPVPLR